jgi:hypothetical protein
MVTETKLQRIFTENSFKGFFSLLFSCQTLSALSRDDEEGKFSF